METEGREAASRCFDLLFGEAFRLEDSRDTEGGETRGEAVPRRAQILTPRGDHEHS